MFYKTINKNFVFVISVLAVCLAAAGCDFVHSNSFKPEHRNTKPFSDRFEKPDVIGTIRSKEIRESSGLVASRCQPDIFWTHNDSGNENHIYALDRKGERLGTYQVAGSGNDDWEDIATVREENGECFLYLGDIGNNDLGRSELTVYRFREPAVDERAAASDRKRPLPTLPAEAIRFSYPKEVHNAETLLVHPRTRDIYVLTKRMRGAAGVYRLTGYAAGRTGRLEEIGRISLPAIPNGLLTGGEISADGKRVILCDYYNGYELVLPEKAEKFDEIWKDEPSIIELGEREQGEAICYSPDGGAVYATSEKKDSPLIEVRRKVNSK